MKLLTVTLIFFEFVSFLVLKVGKYVQFLLKPKASINLVSKIVRFKSFFFLRACNLMYSLIILVVLV